MQNIDSLCGDVRATKAKLRSGDASLATREKLAGLTSGLTEEEKRLVTGHMKAHDARRRKTH